MDKISFGQLTLDAEWYSPLEAQGVFSDPFLHSIISDMVKRKPKMHWSCRDQSRRPDPFPTSFEESAHLLIYHNPNPTTFPPLGEDVIGPASAAAGLAFMRAAGFADIPALVRAVDDVFGRHKVTFDVDAFIANDKLSHTMEVEVSLHFEHFRLTADEIDPAVLVVISLPDRLVMRRKRISICRDGEEEPYFPTDSGPGFYQLQFVPAANELSLGLRRRKLDERSANALRQIRLAEQEMADVEQLLEQMAPKPN